MDYLPLLRETYQGLLSGELTGPLYICCNYEVKGTNVGSGAVLSELKESGFIPSNIVVECPVGTNAVNLGIWLSIQDLDNYTPEMIERMFDINFLATRFM